MATQPITNRKSLHEAKEKSRGSIRQADRLQLPPQSTPMPQVGCVIFLRLSWLPKNKQGKNKRLTDRDH